jgi:O-antigen/teichoic acid export membrane protein
LNSNRQALLAQAVVFCFSSVLILAASVLTARFLGPYNQGLLSYALSVASVLLPLSELAVSGSLLTELSNGKDTAKTTAAALYLRAVGSVIYALAFFPFFLFEANIQVRQIFGVLIVTSFATLPHIADSFYLFKGQGVRLSFIRLLQPVSRMSLTLLFISMQLPLAFFAITILAEALLKDMALFLDLGVLKIKSLLSYSFDRESVKSFFDCSLPLTISSISGLLMLKSDQVILRWFDTPESIGLYSVAALVVNTLFQLPSLYALTIMPSLGKQNLVDSDVKTKCWKDFFKNLWLIGFILALFAGSCSFLISHLFGEAYAGSALPCLVLAPSVLFVAISISQGTWLKLNGLNKLIATRSVFALTLNLALNFVLIPPFGMIGAAAATIISQIGNILFFPPGDRVIARNMTIALLPAF